jgi:type IX secretion system PorP/SprF family membrane protein
MSNTCTMKYLLFGFLLLTGSAVCGQQLNTSSFYDLHPVLHNPATAGSRKTAMVGASFKKQWSSMPGSPQSGVVYGQTFLPTARIGVGGYLYHDVTGPTSRTGLQMAWAYHVPLSDDQRLSFGFEARLQQLGFDRAKLQAQLGAIDPVLLNMGNRLKADAGFGVAYTSSTLQLGASVSQLVQSKYKLYEVYGTSAAQSRLYRHWYFHGAYSWKVDEATLFIPHALFIYLPNAPAEVQTGVRIAHSDLLWYGLSWRFRQGWIINAGMNLNKKFKIGYSFDLYQSPMSIYEKGSTGHELLLQYAWK